MTDDARPTTSISEPITTLSATSFMASIVEPTAPQRSLRVRPNPAALQPAHRSNPLRAGATMVSRATGVIPTADPSLWG